MNAHKRRRLIAKGLVLGASGLSLGALTLVLVLAGGVALVAFLSGQPLSWLAMLSPVAAIATVAATLGIFGRLSDIVDAYVAAEDTPVEHGMLTAQDVRRMAWQGSAL